MSTNESAVVNLAAQARALQYRPMRACVVSPNESLTISTNESVSNINQRERSCYLSGLGLQEGVEGPLRGDAAAVMVWREVPGGGHPPACLHPIGASERGRRHRAAAETVWLLK